MSPPGGAALVLVLGGAASGKSAYAEKITHASGLQPVYVATAQAWDDEMAAKISRHRDRRGAAWRTIEAPRDLASPLGQATAGDMVLIDCLTLWLTNHLLAESDLEAEVERLAGALAACAAPVVAVSNEVGQGIVPPRARCPRREPARHQRRPTDEQCHGDP